MQARNIKDNGNGTLDMELLHPAHGWIPFTASPDDVEAHGRERYEKAIAGEYGEIAPYVAPAEPTPEEVLQAKRQAAVLTRREFFHALDAAGMYDVVMALKDDPATPRAVVIDLQEAQTFERLFPTLLSAAAQLEVTDEQLDAVFGIV